WASAGSGDDPGLGGQANAVAGNAQLLGRRELEQRALQRLLVESDGRSAGLDGLVRGALGRTRLNLIRGDEGRGHRPEPGNEHSASLVHDRPPGCAMALARALSG